MTMVSVADCSSRSSFGSQDLAGIEDEAGMTKVEKRRFPRMLNTGGPWKKQ